MPSAGKRIGWWEDYACGCVSETAQRKRDLLGYCPLHGASRRLIWPENPFVEATDDQPR